MTEPAINDEDENVERHDGQTRRTQLGMTLVEVLVFMFLTLMVLGTSITLSMQTGKLDYTTKISLGAFLFNKSATERLVSGGYAEATNGFSFATNNTFQTGSSSTNFYRNIPATHVLQLQHGHDDDIGNYYKATSMLVWHSPSSGHSVTNRFSTFLYESLGAK